MRLVLLPGYTHDYLYYLSHDAFRFGSLDGVTLPGWEHLWFVAYLWAFTMALVLLSAELGWLAGFGKPLVLALNNAGTEPEKNETFELGAKWDLLDGALEIRAPCDDCTIFMPARQAIVGREGVYLTRPLD